jgi:hypothetical protein
MLFGASLLAICAPRLTVLLPLLLSCHTGHDRHVTWRAIVSGPTSILTIWWSVLQFGRLHLRPQVGNFVLIDGSHLSSI